METQEQPVKRLCSEIQLFDLCELDDCRHKEGRFCTEARILERFEAIKEEDERSYVAEEMDDDEADEVDEEEFGSDEFEDDY